MKNCSQCRTQYDEDQFIDKKNIVRSTCIKCRNKSKRNKDKNLEKSKIYAQNWKKAKPLYVKNTNEFYRMTTTLSNDDRALLLTMFKNKQNLFDKDSQKNNHHYKIDNIMGKDCNVSKCGWKPLNIFYYNDRSWDKLTSTCSVCIQIRSTIRQVISSDINEKLKAYRKTNINDTIIHPYLGSTIQDFVKYIESLFTEGMSWDKRGSFTNKQDGFHIDHIIPYCAFDFTDPKDLFLCFHWKNCQPLWGIENMSKGHTYTLDQKQSYIDSMNKFMLSDYTVFTNLIQKVSTNILSNIRHSLHNIDYHDICRKQQVLYNDYVFDQALQDMQVMFFTYENPIYDNKTYKGSLYLRMKNKHSRKTGEENSVSKKVCKVTMDGKHAETYVSMSDCAKKNNTYHSSVSKCCTSAPRLFMSGGYYWCFLHDLAYLQHRISFARVLADLRQ